MGDFCNQGVINIEYKWVLKQLRGDEKKSFENPALYIKK